MRTYQTVPTSRRQRAFTLVEVLLAILLLGGTSLAILHLMRDYARVVQRTEFEAIAAGRCESVLALCLSSREASQFSQTAAEMSDDLMSLKVQLKDTGHEQLRLVSVTAEGRQPMNASSFTLSRLIYLESL